VWVWVWVWVWVCGHECVCDGSLIWKFVASIELHQLDFL
jgi:hypothetical protein